jgi:hypothetical protein
VRERVLEAIGDEQTQVVRDGRFNEAERKPETDQKRKSEQAGAVSMSRRRHTVTLPITSGASSTRLKLSIKTQAGVAACPAIAQLQSEEERRVSH